MDRLDDLGGQLGDVFRGPCVDGGEARDGVVLQADHAEELLHLGPGGRDGVVVLDSYNFV